MSREEMKKAARIAARHVKPAKVKTKKKGSLISRVARKLKKIYGKAKMKPKAFESERTKYVKRRVEGIKTDAEKRRAAKKKKKY